MNTPNAENLVLHLKQISNTFPSTELCGHVIARQPALAMPDQDRRGMVLSHLSKSLQGARGVLHGNDAPDPSSALVLPLFCGGKVGRNMKRYTSALESR